MAKKVNAGSLWVKEGVRNGRKWKSVFLGLGSKSKDPKYNTTLELTIKDSDGNVIHRQTDGLISLVDPRTRPDELLEAGLITEEVYNKMRSGLDKLPEGI